MANKIQSSDLFEENLFKELNKAIEESEKKLDGLSESLGKIGAKLKSELSGLDVKNLESINEILKKNKEIEKSLHSQFELEKEQLKLQAQKEKLQIQLDDLKKKSQEQEIARAKKLQDQEAKRLSKEKKTADDLANAYKRLEKNTRELKNESKRLGAEMLELEQAGKKNTKAYYDLENQYKRVTKSAQEGDKQLKKLDNTVGDSFRNVGNYGKALGGLKQLMERMGLAFGIYQFAQFGKSLVETQVNLDRLKLALQNVSKSTLEYQQNFAFLKSISLSYGQDLLSLVDTYKNFIASTEASNLAMGEKRRIYESIIKAGSALALSNTDIEGTLRAVQQMFSKGNVQAEELRQQLGDRLPGAFSLMAKAVGVSEAELTSMMKNGQVLTDEVMPKFALLLEEQFGKNAKKNLETVNGAFNNLKTNLTLYIDQAQKSINLNKSFAWFLTKVSNNLGILFKAIRQVVTAFALYKTTLIIAESRQRMFSSGLFSLVKALFKGELSFKSLSEAVKGFALSLKKVALFVAIEGIVLLYEKVMQLANGYELATANYLKFKNATSEGRKKANKFIQDRKEELEEFKKTLKEKLDLTKASDKKIYDEKVKAKQNEIKADYKAENERLLNIVESFKKLQDKIKERADKEIGFGFDPSKTPEASGMFKVQYEMYKKGLRVFSTDAEKRAFQDYAKKLSLFTSYQSYQSGITKAYEEINTLNDELRQNAISFAGAGKGAEGAKTPFMEHTREVADMNTQYKELNPLLDEYLTIMTEINQLNADKKASDLEEGIAKTLEDALNTASKYGYVEEGTIRKAIAEKVKAQLEAEELRYKAESGKFLLEAEQETRKELDDLDKQRKDKQKDLDEINSDIARLTKDVETNKSKQNKSKKQDARLAKEAEDLITALEDAKKKRDEILEGFDKKTGEILERDETRKKNANANELKILKDHENKKKKIKKDGQEETDEVLNNAQELADLKRLNDIKKLANSTNDLIQMGMDNYIKTLERNISFIEDRMNRLNQNIDYLQQKAAEGNITAQESLAKAQKDQLDAEKEKANFQRTIQRMQLAMTVFNAYNSNVQNAQLGENPFTKTITDISALTAFIGQIPTFYEGTETTIADALGNPMMQGKDGYVVRVDGSEKVLNPYLSAKTGNLTTRDIAQIAEDRLKGKLVYGSEINSTANNMWASMQLIDEIQDLKSIIKNKPETNIAMGEIVGGVMKIVETTKVANTTTRNIHRFNKNI